MIILAIDPGYSESHAVRFDAALNRVVGNYSMPNHEMLGMLRALGFSGPKVIESMDPFGLRLGRETMDTILWIGRFQEAARAELVPRSLVKMTLCGNRKADDSSIRHVLIDRLGKPGTIKNPGPTYGVSGHRWQALAVAVTYLEVTGRLRNQPTQPPVEQPALFEEGERDGTTDR